MQACDLSAVEARRQIGNKVLSPVELLDSCLARIEAVNPPVTGVVAIAYGAARARAKEAEAQVMAGVTFRRFTACRLESRTSLTLLA